MNIASRTFRRFQEHVITVQRLKKCPVDRQYCYPMIADENCRSCAVDWRDRYGRDAS